MSVKRLNYRAIPAPRRKNSAYKAAARLRQELQLNPALTDKQKAAINAKLKRLSKWAAGKLDAGEPIPPTPAPEPAGTNHEVVVSETVEVEANNS